MLLHTIEKKDFNINIFATSTGYCVVRNSPGEDTVEVKSFTSFEDAFDYAEKIASVGN